MPRAYIGMGANLPSSAGAPEATLAAAAKRLEQFGQIAALSSLYSTEPMGLAGQPRFVNAVVALETGVEPRALLEALLRVEQEFGRDRSAGIANGPRTLDLDLLLYGDCVVHAPGLEVPHPRLGERAFVLVPLCEIDPRIVDASSGNSVSQLLHDLCTSVLTNSLASDQDAVVLLQYDGWHAGPFAGAGSTAVTEHCDADRRG